ncbi:MAG: molybdenum cofactor biosynthesis protein MoaE [Candidatus Wallbacteria bacterium]|nr:molybdenum cofactor biosynthesis protein MoaE [Candidatus Wallbacteria bacterium]
MAGLEDPSSGAVTLFLGRVRDHHEGHEVRSIHYQAYAEMALPVMGSIAEETLAKFPVSRIAILHRVGHLQVGEVSVLVAVASAHRDEAFRACRHGIDRIKQDVPIWKKEVLADGTEEWVDARCGGETRG